MYCIFGLLKNECVAVINSIAATIVNAHSFPDNYHHSLINPTFFYVSSYDAL